MTDTALYADIVLPATTQLEQVDMHARTGHRLLHYNIRRSIPPHAESVSNWDLMRRLSTAMGFPEPWLHEEPDEIIDELLTVSARTNPYLEGITLERLKRDGVAELNFNAENWVPFADGIFPTPSGKVELYSVLLCRKGT